MYAQIPSEHYTVTEEMTMRHEFKKIEPKWQKKWADQEIFKAVDGSEKPKFYGLVEFPYPSGAGMHVGHIMRSRHRHIRVSSQTKISIASPNS